MKARKFCIIALVLAIVLLIAPISESRAEEELDVKTSGDYDYIVLGDETACITKYNGNDEKVIIPEKLDGIRVTGIGDYAFLGKTNLKEITISDSVESIGINPFAQCKNLLNINISPNHPTLLFLDNVLFYKPEKKIVSYLCASEKSKYEIPKGIKIIGDSAFSGCKNLEKINIPDSVQLIGDSAFSFLENLTEIKIPDGVKFIGEGAFYGCTSLTEIKIPDSVENIGINPFNSCTNLLNVNISANNPTLEFVDNALIYKPEKKIVSYLSASYKSEYEIPDGIESIGVSAFEKCTNLKKIKIPDSVKAIGNSAFSYCINLTEIAISDSVNFIGNGAFAGCNDLIEINLPISISSICDREFFSCRKLKKITIPDNVNSIGDMAFFDCVNLTEIIIPDNVKSLGDSAFYGCDNLKKINIPASIDTIGEDAFEYCDNLTATVARDSYAEKYCKENKINYMYEDSLDWLKN